MRPFLGKIKMKLINIDEEIISKATKCRNRKSCLNSELNKCCKVESIVENNFCQVDYNKKGYCNYRTSLNFSDTCCCPLRIEIYRRFSK